MTSYADFLARKTTKVGDRGRSISRADVHPVLHDWQADIVTWGVRKGRAAFWEDTGLGKTIQQLEWARLSGDTSLIVAPLAVCHQTVGEASRMLDLPVGYVRDDADITGPGVWITNTELVAKFDPARLDAVVLDEASILKNSTGKTRNLLVEHFAPVPHRLACTATPAPNDPEELTSQAEYLGICSRVDMLSTYFIHDDQGWRLKRHAVRPMYEWLASWAVALRRPSDLGYSDDGYDLPGLEIVPELLQVDLEVEGQLFATDLGGVGGRAKIRRETLAARCARAAELVAAEPDEPWLLWCGMNDEADELARRIPGAVNVHGSLSPEDKAAALLGFADGTIRHLITKPKIASFGMNWQHCARMAFVGLSDSYEQYYQAIRRCYRYGQPRIVRAHVVLSELESQIARNVERKGHEASALTEGLVAAMRTAHTLQEAA
jgi:hypothetical protein